MTYPQVGSTPVIYADEETRAAFLVKVYQHLALAIGGFIVFETLLFMSGLAEAIFNFLVSSGGAAWLLILGGFAIVNMIASRSTTKMDNVGAQYGGLFAVALAEAIIFAPFLYMVFNQNDGATTVQAAAIITLIGFGALSVVAFTTKKDLSFLRPLIMWGSIVALGLIVGAVVLNFDLGVIFTFAMIALAGASILYQTQTIIRTYPEWAYVAAAVGLFASLMMMFWYVLRLLSRR